MTASHLTSQSKELVEAIRLILAEFPNAQVNISLTLETEASPVGRLLEGGNVLKVRAASRATRKAPVYRTPSLHSPVIAHLADGGRVTATGEALGEFLEISDPVQGWVESALLERE